jgi:hypothetical protein
MRFTGIDRVKRRDGSMRSFTLRTLAVALIMSTLSFGFLAWRWPARWRLPVRPGGTINQRSDRRTASDDIAPVVPQAAWWVVIGIMAILVAIWLLVVLL